MTLFSNLWYLIRWPFYLFACMFHAVYQFSVFLSKPGALAILACLAHSAAIFLHIQHEGFPHYSLMQPPRDWYDITVNWISYDRAQRGLWFYVEVPLLVIALAFQMIPRDWLRAALGLFPAKARPLPPMRSIQAPKFKIKAMKVRLTIAKRRRYFLRFPYEPKHRLPRAVYSILHTKKVLTLPSVMFEPLSGFS